MTKQDKTTFATIPAAPDAASRGYAQKMTSTTATTRTRSAIQRDAKSTFKFAKREIWRTWQRCQKKKNIKTLSKGGTSSSPTSPILSLLAIFPVSWQPSPARQCSGTVHALSPPRQSSYWQAS